MDNQFKASDKDAKDITEAISSLARAIGGFTHQKETEFDWVRATLGFATKHDLIVMEHNIMSAISEFKTKQDAFNARIDAAVAGVSADVAALNAEIVKLQNSVGTVTPEDQASLDAIQARSEAIATKLEALDALTPPVPPTT